MDANTASKEELVALRGISDQLADTIIESRPFDAIGDLVDISGIGPRSLERLVSQGLTVGQSDRDQDSHQVALAKEGDNIIAFSGSPGRGAVINYNVLRWTRKFGQVAK